MRVVATIVPPLAMIAFVAPALAKDAPPDSGVAKLAAYQVCHPLALVDMGASGSQAAIECNGIVRNLESQKRPDNLAIHCLESSGDRRDGHKYSGACVQTDSQGDKIYMTYEGSDTGQVKWIGGTGKYSDITGAGTLAVVVAPGGTPTLFAYTLNYDVTWTRKAK